MNGNSSRYATLYFQRNLVSPDTPIPLGIVIVRKLGDYVEEIALGRIPSPGKTPPELEGIHPLLDKALRRWFSQVQAILDGDLCPERVFRELQEKFRLNLYFTAPKPIAMYRDIDQQARSIWNSILGGTPYATMPRRADGLVQPLTVQEIPPAWMLCSEPAKRLPSLRC